MELLSIRKERRLRKTQEAQEVEEIELILINVCSFANLINNVVRDCQHIKQEDSLQIPFGDKLQITYGLSLLEILVLHEKVSNDVKTEEDFHDPVKHLYFVILRWSETGVVG